MALTFIQCITCGEKWTHGADKDGSSSHPSYLAAKHEQDHQNDPGGKHVVLVGEADTLAALYEEQQAKRRG